MHHKVWLSILLILSLSAGCSLPFPGMGEKTGESKLPDTLGLTPDFSYEVREQTPNILINQTGYASEDSKTAILRGNELQPVFQVCLALTGETVYQGVLDAGSLHVHEEGEEATEKDNYLADFSAVKAPGTYYIYQPDLGYSYEFKIGSNDRESLEESLLAYLETEQNSTALLCYQTAGLLLTEELYPEALADGERFQTLCRNNMDRLLQAQDAGSGSVYADLSKAGELAEQDAAVKQQFISLAATAEFAGVMAMYAHTLSNIDWNLAYQYRQAAEQAYLSIQASLDNVGYDAGYFAAAQLYRLTGKVKYAQAVGQYLGMAEEQKNYTEYDFSLYGDMACLSFTSGANLEWSELVMKRIMKQAEQISQSGGKRHYFISDQRDYRDVDGILRDASVLALVNYIITNHEYTTLQKNYVDYILGRNPENLCFMPGFGVRNPETKETIDVKNAALFYLLLQGTKL